MKQFIIFLLMVSFVFSMGRKPDWVKERPVNPSYYIGIGMAFKEYNPDDYQQKATESALQDLASQIKISIQSTNIREIVEKNQNISETYTSYLKTALAADLEGYELVDTWENDKEYWVYYRLHKAKYEAIRRAKIEKAMSLALDYLSRADQLAGDNKLAEAIQFYFKGLEAVEKYATEPLVADYNGKEIYLMNELISRLQKFTSSLKFQSPISELQIKQGKIPEEPVVIQVFAENEYGNLVPVKNFPVIAKMPGAIIDSLVITDDQGLAGFKISKIINYKVANTIRFQASKEKLLAPEIKSPILRGIIATLNFPEYTIYVRLISATAYITGTEKNLDRPVKVLHIVPALKQALVDHGFKFVDNPSQADFIIKISANTVKGAKVYSLYTAFADVDVSVINAANYKEVYREAIHQVKGIQLDYEKAGLKALESAAKEVVQKVLPNIEKNLQ